jgi:hypothetical protein
MGTAYSPNKSCPNGWRNDGTSCWEDVSCTTAVAHPCNEWNQTCAGGTCLSRSWWDGCCSRGALRECYGCVKTDWCASRTSVTCTENKSSCKNCGSTGRRNDGISCWEDSKCSGCGCIKQGVNKDCGNGDLDALGALCYPKCRNGYHKNPGDIVSCWNDNPTSKPITDKQNLKLTVSA